MLFFQGRACKTDFWGKAFVYIGSLLSLSLPPPLLVPLSVLLWLPWPSPLPLLLAFAFAAALLTTMGPVLADMGASTCTHEGRYLHDSHLLHWKYKQTPLQLNYALHLLLALALPLLLCQPLPPPLPLSLPLPLLLLLPLPLSLPWAFACFLCLCLFLRLCLCPIDVLAIDTSRDCVNDLYLCSWIVHF